MTGRGRAAALAASGALVVTLSVLLPARTPPVYDGLPLQTEPYRYLQPPAGSAQTQAPTSATQDVSVSDGASEPFVLATAENPPQAQLIAGGNAFAAPAGQSRITVTITPVPPPPAKPSGGVDGNVYRVAATAAGAPVALRPGGSVSVVLRGTGASGSAALQRFDGRTWSPLATNRTGSDTYIGNPPALGDFALVLAAGGSPAGGGGGGGGAGLGVIIGIAAAVLVVAGILAGIRVARSR